MAPAIAGLAGAFVYVVGFQRNSECRKIRQGCAVTPVLKGLCSIDHLPPRINGACIMQVFAIRTRKDYRQVSLLVSEGAERERFTRMPSIAGGLSQTANYGCIIV